MVKTSNKLASRIISGLAILVANMEQGKDYLDIFVPFVAQCILVLKPKVVSAKEVQERMESDFGIRVPQDSLKMILHRVAKRGYIKRSNGAYVPDNDALNNLNFESNRRDVIRKQNAAVEKLMTFAVDRFGVKFNRDEAENILLNYIRQNDIELLDCSLGNKELAIVETGKTEKKVNFIVNSFIIHMFENDPEGYEQIDIIVKGLFLTYSLVFPELDQIQKRFRRTDAYLDTPMILRVLGYEGIRRSEPCKELLELLYKEGAHIKCFRHTRDEVFGVLYGCMASMRKGELVDYPGPTYSYLLESGYGPGEIELELVALDKRIEALGIKIVEKPEYIERFQIDEKKLEEVLKAERKYWQEREKQRIHDVSCLSAIYRLREGRNFSYFEECKAIFVTPNSALCSASSQFFTKEGYLERGSVPVVITDYAMNTLVWLKKAVEAPDLPQKYIIAECYAAIEPSKQLWKKYSSTANRLKERKEISADDYYLLRYSQVVHSELMQITMGDENAITEGTAQEILKRIKEEIRKEDLAKIEEERRRHEEKEEESLAKIREERKLGEEKERKLKYEQTLNRNRIKILNENIENKSRRIAYVISRITFFVVIIVILGGALFSLLNFLEGTFKYIMVFLYVIFVLFATLHLIYGITIKDHLARYEVVLAKGIQSRFKKWFLNYK